MSNFWNIKILTSSKGRANTSALDRHDLGGFVGKHLVYAYDNGWNYEICVKNGTMLDYRIYDSIAGNCWMRDQRAYTMWVGEGIYKISWTGPIGTNVSLIINLGDKLFHSAIFLPRWVINNPEKTVRFQNDHAPLMMSYRDAGPAYPAEVIDEFTTIISVHDHGTNNDDVIAYAASELSKDLPEDLH